MASDPDASSPLRALTLEHYAAMTEKELAVIDAEAGRRWELMDTRIVHRYGRLTPGERIVLVAVAARHRDTAFEACRFLIDCLKSRAPLWKHEETAAGGGGWVEPGPADAAAVERWLSPVPGPEEA
jgi:molybdopterin synthase catalytic subunit